MNVERSPVINDEVLFWRDCNDAHLWMLAEQLVTNGRASPGVVERDDHEIRQGSLYALGNLRFVADFPDNFDVRLIRERCEYELPHEPRTICHEDPDSFFHCLLRARLVSVHQVSKCPFFRLVRGRFKKCLFKVISTPWVMYQAECDGYQQ